MTDLLAATIRGAAHRLTGAAGDYDPLLALMGGARFVLLGEASHGTHEFYQARAEITPRLIVERGFTAVAAEADWPDADRVNRYVRGMREDQSAAEALGDFRRFPAWMWRNADVLDFVGWLRAHTRARRIPGPESGGTSAPLRRAPRPSGTSAPCSSSSAAERPTICQLPPHAAHR